MERIINGYAGFECINSDLSTTVCGGGLWGSIVKFFKDHLDQFLLGFIEGWSGQDIVDAFVN